MAIKRPRLKVGEVVINLRLGLDVHIGVLVDFKKILAPILEKLYGEYNV